MTRPAQTFLLAAAAAALLLPACKSTGSSASTTISNFKYFHLDPDSQIETPDPMIAFERRQHLHGRITRAEQEEAEGHYYVAWWEDEVRTPAVVRLEYRQENTGSQVKVLEKAVDDVRRRNKTYFKITGEEYHTGGKVTAFQVSIVRDGQTVASHQSYLW